MNIRIKLLSPEAITPKYQTEGASGLDLHATHAAVVPAMGRASINTGVAFEIPSGFEGHVRPRSGLARKNGVFAVYGTIDSDYRGAVGVTLLNVTGDAFMVKAGDRIAQIAFSRVERAVLIESDELDDTERGTGGFGSTGR